MLKKYFFSLILILSFVVFDVLAEEKENPPIPTCYSIRCYKCDQYNEKHPGYGNAGGIAERRFECEKSGEHTFVYKCPYGHVLYIDTQTGERK